jgi:hypothetical protein
MISELEVLYARLDSARMTAADRALARAHLEQAEALAEFLAGALALLRRVVRMGGTVARRPSQLSA